MGKWPGAKAALDSPQEDTRPPTFGSQPGQAEAAAAPGVLSGRPPRPGGGAGVCVGHTSAHPFSPLQRDFPWPPPVQTLQPRPLLINPNRGPARRPVSRVSSPGSWLLAPFSCPSVTGHPPTARPGVLCPSFVHSTHNLEPLTKTSLGSLPEIPPHVWCPSCGLRAHSLAHGPLPRQLSYCSVLLVDKPAPPAPQAPGDRDRDRFCSLSRT